MKVAYARLSSEEQNLDKQLTNLRKFGAEKFFTEKNLEQQLLIEKNFKKQSSMFVLEIFL